MSTDKETRGSSQEGSNYERPPHILRLQDVHDNEQQRASQLTTQGDALIKNRIRKWRSEHLTPTNVLTFVIAAAAWAQFSVTQGQLKTMNTQLAEMRRSGQETSDQTSRIINNMNWLAKEMYHSVQEAEITEQDARLQSQRALDASIGASRTDQRAWFGASSPRITAEPQVSQKDFRIFISAENVGKTPALHLALRSWTGFFFGNEKFPEPNWSSIKKQAAKAMAFPNELGANLSLGFPEITAAALSAYRNHQTSMLACYRFDYSDIFHKPHFTEACFSHEFGADRLRAWTEISASAR